MQNPIVKFAGFNRQPPPRTDGQLMSAHGAVRKARFRRVRLPHMFSSFIAALSCAIGLVGCGGHSPIAPTEEPMDPDLAAEYKEAESVPATVSSDIHAEPDRASAVIFAIEPGVPVAVTTICRTGRPGETYKESNVTLAGWYKVHYPGGVGYAPEASLRLRDIPPYIISKIPDC